MKISIEINPTTIPHIIHGISANTLFYLINYEKCILNHTFNNKNDSCIDIPHDPDDFSRIENAYNCFSWDEKDIEKAKVTAQKLNFPDRVKKFLNKFYEFMDIYKSKGYEGYKEFYALYETLLEEK